MPDVLLLLKSAKFHESWQQLLKAACEQLEPAYLAKLLADTTWLPGLANIFAAFTVPVSQVQTILVGESPYPRAASANGFAFWDAAVSDLWCADGLTKPVNRATSLRNFIKMLLLADGLLSPETLSKASIAMLNKQKLVQTLPDLFHNMLAKGFLLLNANLALGLESKPVTTKLWRPFLDVLLLKLYECNPNITLILFGAHAKTLLALPSAKLYRQLIAEHPLNYSFVTNPEVIAFFKPLKLLRPLPHSTQQKALYATI
jgi:uracil-DNA glycosylase